MVLFPTVSPRRTVERLTKIDKISPCFSSNHKISAKNFTNPLRSPPKTLYSILDVYEKNLKNRSWRPDGGMK